MYTPDKTRVEIRLIERYYELLEKCRTICKKVLSEVGEINKSKESFVFSFS